MVTVFSSVLETLYAARYHILTLFLGTIAWQQWASYRQLAAFKGPHLARFTNLWMAKAVASKEQHLKLFEVYEKYGELARIGPNTLLTSDPELLQRMSSARSGYTRSDWYSGQKLEVDQDNLFSVLDEKIHTRRRAQMAPGYTGREIAGLEEAVDSHMIEYIKLIRRKYLSHDSELRPMDLARKMAFFTMDVTTDIAFGQCWGCLAKDEDIDKWFESSELMLPNAIMVSTIPWLAKLFQIPVIGRHVMPSDKDKIGAGRLLAIVKEVVRRRFDVDAPEDKRDMMGSFIRHGLTRSEAVADVLLQIIAGSDTTATTLRATMLFVITNHHIYTTLQSEIDSITVQGTIISDDQASTLPYLRAVIKEGARMWPPAAGVMSKKTPPEGDTINDVFVPGGIDIGQCAWGVQRSKKVYGEDSMVFRPERWLEATGDTLERMERSLGLIWGYGKYSCLGKNIAWLKLKKCLFELLKNFNFTIIDPTRPWKSESYGLWMQSEMFVRVTERIRG